MPLFNDSLAFVLTAKQPTTTTTTTSTNEWHSAISTHQHEAVESSQ